MKFSLAFIFNYIIFFGAAFLLTPPNHILSKKKIFEIKFEKKQEILVARESTTEIIHSELLFRF